MKKRFVTEIWIYPVKSLGGIRVSAARVMQKGLEHDRRWMLIDSDNRFMTQRTFPQMSLIKLSYEQEIITIHYSGEKMELPLGHSGESMQAIVWDDSVEVVEVSEAHSQWFSRILGIECRLVCFPEANSRPVDANYSINDEQVSLADGFPLLIIGQCSLDDLNSRLKVPVTIDRFRPNIVFSGDGAFEEDNWKTFSIGTVQFAVVKPCARCVMTTVDQDTGKKGIEPLATLATYRKIDNKIYFGQNLLPLSFGEIKAGSEIFLEEIKT